MDLSPSAASLDSPISVDANPESFPSVGGTVRLMCSYGGHIMPRPHDKALSYVGGETRLVVVDRRMSFSSLTSRLSRALLNGLPFSLKYQLPREDLDSLVSVSSDEDLENMMEEYARVSSSESNSRIRLFLFTSKLETASTMGSLLDDAKSESWFVDALNGSVLISRGFSDSAMDNCLVDLKDAPAVVTQKVDESGNLERKHRDGGFRNDLHHEAQLSSFQDTPMTETNSSPFGSPSLAPPMANLPPIRVRVNAEQRIEEQFSQMSLSNVRRPLDEAGSSQHVNVPVVAMTDSVTVAAVNNGAGEGGCNPGRISSDDERSDPGLGNRKSPLPPQTVVLQSRHSGGYNLPSPDSVTSDSSSIASANSFSRSTQSDLSLPPPQVPTQKVSFSGTAILDNPLPQPQPPQTQSLVHIVHQSRPPFPHYYPVYAQPAGHPHQYPVYVMPISMHQNAGDPNTIASTRVVPSPTAIPSSAMPPLYPVVNPQAPMNPEMMGTVYRSTVPANPQMVHIPLSQFESQYRGFAHPQSAAKEMNEQGYYSQLASRYQSFTPAAAAATVSDASKKLPGESVKLQPVNSPSL